MIAPDDTRLFRRGAPGRWPERHCRCVARPGALVPRGQRRDRGHHAPARGGRRRRHLASVGRGRNLDRGDAGLQLRLPAAGRHADHRRPAELGGAVRVPRGQPGGQPPVGGDARAYRRGDGPARRTGPSLRPQPRRAASSPTAATRLPRWPARWPDDSTSTYVAIALPRGDEWEHVRGRRRAVALDRRSSPSAFAAAQATLEFDAYARTYAGHRTIERRWHAGPPGAAAGRHAADWPAGGRRAAGRAGHARRAGRRRRHCHRARAASSRSARPPNSPGRASS